MIPEIIGTNEGNCIVYKITKGYLIQYLVTIYIRTIFYIRYRLISGTIEIFVFTKA